MKREYVLLFDSGSGGDFVLSVFKKVLPNESYILFKDAKNCPYGNKTKANLKQVLFETLKKIFKKYPIKMLVLACNTMSSLFASDVKKNFACPCFFVLPKLSSQILRRPTLLLCTCATAKSKCVQLYCNNKNLNVVTFPTLAKQIDLSRTLAQTDWSNFQNKLCKTNSMQTRAILRSALKKHSKKVCNVVIGCTHYNFVIDQIKHILGKNVKIFENSLSTAQKAKRFLQKNNNLSVLPPHTIVLTNQ